MSRRRWPTVPLTNAVDVLDARRVPVKASERAARGGDVPYYGATGQAGMIDSAIFDEPLILLGEDGAPFFDPYKPKAYLVDGPAWVNNHAHVLRARDIADRRYLKYYLDWFDYRGYANGTTRLKLTQAAMKRMPVLLPEPAEQQRIVEILEDHLSRLDAAADYVSAAQRRLRAMQKTTLLELIPDQANYPNEWRTATVAQAGKLELGRQRHPDWHTGPNMQPYLRVANVFEDRIDTSDLKEMHWDGDTFERFRLHRGDVLLNEGQTPDLLGRPALYRGEPANVAFTNSLIRFKANPAVLPQFALLVFRRHMHAGRFKRESRITTNIAHLSAARLKPIEFPIPPLETQTAIVQAASTRLADIARVEGAISSQAARADNLRRAVLAAAFSGRLTGRATDPAVIEEIAG